MLSNDLFDTFENKRALEFYQIPLFLKQCALVEGVLAKFLVAGILNTYHLMR